MLNSERRSKILEVLKRDGRVLAGELSETFGVSEDTVRRDLRELARDGLLNRVYGGAIPYGGIVPRSPSVPPFEVRAAQNPTAKAAIGRAVADTFKDGQVVILDSGTTPLEVARHLPPDRKLTVVTHSLPVATALAGHPFAKVVVLGGTLLKESLAMVGATTVAAYGRVRADVYVIGVVSLHPQLGMAVFDHEDAEVKRAAIAASAEVVVVAAGEKLGTAAPFVVGPASAVTRLYTDAEGADAAAVAGLREAGVEVVEVGRQG